MLKLDTWTELIPAQIKPEKNPHIQEPTAIGFN